MSYDVSVADKRFNYTWNMSALFYDHIEGGIHSFDGKSGKEVAVLISETFPKIYQTMMGFWDDITGFDDFCKHYDPPNKWGSTEGAIIFLSRIMLACMQHPRTKVRVVVTTGQDKAAQRVIEGNLPDTRKQIQRGKSNELEL